MERPKDMKKREKLMEKYAKVCGYKYAPFVWKATDYTIEEWENKIKVAKEELKKGE